MIVGRAVVTLHDDVLVVVQALLSLSQSEMQRVPPTNTSPIEPAPRPSYSQIYCNILPRVVFVIFPIAATIPLFS